MFFELSVIIFALSFLLFTIYSILYLIQLRRTAKNIESILNKLDQSLPGIISKIDAIVSVPFRDISDDQDANCSPCECHAED